MKMRDLIRLIERAPMLPPIPQADPFQKPSAGFDRSTEDDGKGKSRLRPIHIDYIIDLSGSMDPYRADVARGYAKFVLSQQALGKGTMSATVFASEWKTQHDFVDIDRMPTQLPDINGGTLLYDTIIHRIKGVAANVKPKVQDVVMIIVTDGGDIESRQTAADVCALVNKYRKEGWKFLLYTPYERDAQQMCFLPDEIMKIGGGADVGATFADATDQIFRFTPKR